MPRLQLLIFLAIAKGFAVPCPLSELVPHQTRSLLTVQMQANNRFPQMNTGLSNEMLAAFFGTHLSAKEMMSEPKPEEMETMVKAMEAFHKRCKVPYRFNRDLKHERSDREKLEIPMARVKHVIMAERILPLQRLRQLILTIERPAPALAPISEQDLGNPEKLQKFGDDFDKLFTSDTPQGKALAQKLQLIGEALIEVRASPEVNAVAQRYHDFMGDPKRRSDPEQDRAIRQEIQRAYIAALRAATLKRFPDAPVLRFDIVGILSAP